MSEAESGDIEERVARLEELALREAAPRRQWDGYTAVIASFIGILALAISAYTAYVQRQQLRAQMWPRIEISYANGLLEFYVTNQGTGPARIVAMRVTVGGVPVANWDEAKNVGGFTGAARYYSADIDGNVLPAGKVVTVAKPMENEQSRERIKDLLPGQKLALGMTICYCSLLDECWVTDSKSRNPQEIARADACPIPAAERFH